METDAVSRRAVVTAVEDDRRRGTLFFDNGDEQSFQWAELTQPGRWQIDTGPRPTQSADELRDLILRSVQRHPVCPAGMDVQIRHATGDDWEALAVPPPGQHTAHADCVDHIKSVARSLRSLYGVRVTRIEGTTLIPTGSVSAGPSASTTPSMAEIAVGGTIQNNVAVAMTVNRGVAGAAEATVEHRLGERPTEIREAARRLSEAIADQITELHRSTPNDPDRLVQQNDFVAFLETIADGLNSLADALDGTAALGLTETPRPILLGKAAEIARDINTAIVEGIERNRSYIVDCSIRFCLYAAGFELLHAIGVDLFTASVVAARRMSACRRKKPRKNSRRLLVPEPRQNHRSTSQAAVSITHGKRAPSAGRVRTDRL